MSPTIDAVVEQRFGTTERPFGGMPSLIRKRGRPSLIHEFVRKSKNSKLTPHVRYKHAYLNGSLQAAEQEAPSVRANIEVEPSVCNSSTSGGGVDHA